MGYNGIENYIYGLKAMPVQNLPVFLANTSTHGWIKYHVEKNLTPSCLRGWLTGIMEK